MHFVQVISDEGLYGLLARHLHINGFSNHLIGLRRLTGKRIYSLADLLVDEIASVYPHFNMAERYKLGTVLLEKHLGNDATNALNLATFSYGNMAHRFWKTCEICEKEDKALNGISIWHRKHQLLTTLKCPVHHSDLHRHKINKKLMHDKLMMPFDTHGVAKKQGIQFEKILIDIAQLGNEALSDEQAPYSSAAIKQTFLTEMYRRRYISNEKVNSNYFYDFESFFGTSFIDLMKFEWGINLVQDLLNGIINETEEKTHVKRLILIYWWFGNWTQFKEKCLWSSVFEKRETVLSSKSYIATRDSYRERGLKLLEAKPFIGRSDFIKIDYKTFRWLKYNDEKWLDRFFPIRGFARQLKLF